MNEITLHQLPKILDHLGNPTFIEGENHIPFEIKRGYWIYDVPGGEVRGGHAFKEQCEFVVALSGSFDMVIPDGKKEQRFQLNRPYYGLFISKRLWRHTENFSANAVALVLSSTFNNEDDHKL
jgi:hypothetical protein